MLVAEAPITNPMIIEIISKPITAHPVNSVGIAPLEI